MNGPLQVIENVLTNMWNNAWNTRCLFKNHNGTYSANHGGLWINWEQAINWANFDLNTQVNLATPSQGAVDVGFTSINSHDPQVCLQYLHAVALWKTLFPNDTRFDQNNANGFMGVSAMVDHVTTDFAPAVSSSTGGYNNPKGWVYYALLDCYLGLQHSPLLTLTQVQNLFNSMLYQAFTYTNTYWDATNQYLVDTQHNTYQPSQSLLMSAAVIDAAQRFPSSIFSGMFYDATPFSPQTPAGWITAGTESGINLISRGAWNPVYQFFYGEMNVLDGASADSVNDPVCKMDDISECVVGLIRLYSVTGNQLYQQYAYNLANSIDSQTLDRINGGYYTNMTVSTGVVNKAYKETRATAHMLYAYALYEQYIKRGQFTQRLEKIITTLCNGYYQSIGGGGFFYRTLPGAGFGPYHDNYTPDFSSTLAAPINIGDTTCSVFDNPTGVGGVNECTIIHRGGANEEQMVIDYSLTSGSGPYTLTYNQGANSPKSFQQAHLAGEAIQTMLYPITLLETQYTTEAMGNVSLYLLYGLIQLTEDLYNVSDLAVQTFEIIGAANTSVFSVDNTGAVIEAQSLTVSAGTIALLGTILKLNTTGSAASPSGAGVTITTNAVVNRTNPGTVTGAILAPGTQNGQVCLVTNEAQNTSHTITFDVPATSNVWDDGTNPVVIKAGTARMFVWIKALNSGSGAWVSFGPYTG